MIHNYLQKVEQQLNTRQATEHSYRGLLQTLLEDLTASPDIQIINEPKRITEVGAPDYLISQKKNNIPIGYIEAKDIGEPLTGKKHEAQFKRYKSALTNLIITDYLQFDFYIQGKQTASIRLADISDTKVIPSSEGMSQFTELWRNFIQAKPIRITSPEKLAEMMATKARLMQGVLEKSLKRDIESTNDGELYTQFQAFKKMLIHDITPDQFADIYAQTIAYGMFSARIHDTTLDSFSRQEAAELIPKSNPFLRKLFSYIAGVDLDDRLVWIVDDLVEIFKATDLEEILSTFSKNNQDPIIHFYETFLASYNPQLRKSRGIWYTPEAVVGFIIRAVDEVLQTQFDLPQGLADTSTRSIQVPARGSKGTITKDVHTVQVLDPATGTGTFLAATIQHIHQQHFAGQQGIWQSYVESDLLPRLHGFELLMASYAMAHIKLEMSLKQTGCELATDKRLQIYLTNALEESHPDTGTLFAQWLAKEAEEANHIKRDTPVMVVLGNPPYSVESQNKGNWIMKLMDDYKKEPGGTEKLKERNPKSINDDYMKFIRMSQHYIERNGQGVVAFINPHGFLDNPTFRGVRWHLLNTFDSIYCLDLHGNSKKKETAPDGGIDENVFDIMQGVSINLFIKTGKKKAKQLAQVFHYDLFGTRQEKYAFLAKNTLSDIPFVALPNKAPMYFMVPKDFSGNDKYNKGFQVSQLFSINTSGINTHRDSFTIHDTALDVSKTVNDFLSLSDEEARTKFNLGKDTRDWKVEYARNDLKNNEGKIIEVAYRPFDIKHTFYTGKSKGFHSYPRVETMRHFLQGDNVGLVTVSRQPLNGSTTYYFLSEIPISNGYIRSDSVSIDSVFPLYIYPNEEQKDHLKKSRKPNLDETILADIAKQLKLPFVPEKRDDKQATFAPIDLLDYIYAVLHSPSYRDRYKEFLKIDFPRVPYPKNSAIFWQLVALGGQIRSLHLLEAKSVTPLITKYPIEGSNAVTRSIGKNDYQLTDTKKQLGNVLINDSQYFEGVPQIAWEFFIGGYQPAQKWLKDRKETTLDHQDIIHYQKIILALTKTHQLMQEILKVKF